MNKGIMVVKVGTGVLSKPSGKLDASYIASLAGQICKLIKLGYKVVLVSSGAIGAGVEALGLRSRPKHLTKLQACAAVGQGRLMKLYEESFRRQGVHAAQVLLTSDDLGIRKRCINARHTINCLLDEFNTVPIVNENDTIATEEIKFGDNDRLSYLVASLINSNTLVLLTDVDGLYSSEDKKVVPIVTHISNEIQKMVRPCKGRFGTGGMASKLKAAEVSMSLGITCVIANGRMQDVLLKIARQDTVGTTFLSTKVKVKAKQCWLAFCPKPKGTVIVDEGAKTALVKSNKSLLAAGIKRVSGKFQAGDVISISNIKGAPFAKGMVSFSSEELKKIKGLKTAEIEERLHRKVTCNEVVHKDNLAILKV